MADNPILNVREWAGRNPIRIVIDRKLELTKDLHIFDQSQDTIIFNEQKTELDGKIKYLELEDFDNYLPQLILYQFYLMDIQSLIVEGGLKTLNLFLQADLWDEARVFTGPQIWEQGIPAPALKGEPNEVQNIGPDMLKIWHNKS